MQLQKILDSIWLNFRIIRGDLVVDAGLHIRAPKVLCVHPKDQESVALYQLADDQGLFCLELPDWTRQSYEAFEPLRLALTETLLTLQPNKRFVFFTVHTGRILVLVEAGQLQPEEAPEPVQPLHSAER